MLQLLYKCVDVSILLNLTGAATCYLVKIKVSVSCRAIQNSLLFPRLSIGKVLLM